MKACFRIVFLVFVMCITVWSSMVFGGNKKLMTIQKAKDLARRAIVESVIGLKIKSNSLWANRPSDYYDIESKVSAQIKGIEFDKIQYDKDKDIAKAVACIRLGSVQNIIGKNIVFDNARICRVAFATSSPEYMPSLKALRAAELNAYDELAKIIVGENLASKTTTHNFVLKDDIVRTKALAAIWGAELKDFGWDEDVNAFVTLRLNAKWVRDIMGNVVKYSTNYIEVTGHGSPVDDLSDSTGSGQNFIRKNSNVESTSFNIPKAGGTNTDNTEDQPATGGSVLR